jgi:hypothetical protein
MICVHIHQPVMADKVMSVLNEINGRWGKECYGWLVFLSHLVGRYVETL